MNVNGLLGLPYTDGGENIESSSDLIASAILDRKPLMIARFGSVEIKGVLYPRLPEVLKRVMRRRVFHALRNNAGFFPVSERSVSMFSELMFQDMPLVDILGSWRFEERFLGKSIAGAKRVKLKYLEPYFSPRPWSKSLEGLKVVVVHPFGETIKKQYDRRALLFSNPDVLPTFSSLKVIKSVQSIAGNDGGYSSWFSALEFMKGQLDEMDYDVAIIGCGAYGFPLAAHVKRSGRIGIHLGGATQILFGVRGGRWDDHPVISEFYNDNWVRPVESDRPKGAHMVEGGCYW